MLFTEAQEASELCFHYGPKVKKNANPQTESEKLLCQKFKLEAVRNPGVKSRPSPVVTVSPGCSALTYDYA